MRLAVLAHHRGRATIDGTTPEGGMLPPEARMLPRTPRHTQAAQPLLKPLPSACQSHISRTTVDKGCLYVARPSPCLSGYRTLTVAQGLQCCLAFIRERIFLSCLQVHLHKGQEELDPRWFNWYFSEDWQERCHLGKEKTSDWHEVFRMASLSSSSRPLCIVQVLASVLLALWKWQTLEGGEDQRSLVVGNKNAFSDWIQDF